MGSNSSKDTSRFSRRRFIQTGVKATPVLLAIKSPATWGGGQSLGNGNCSISVLMSANASTPNCTADIKSPGYWHSVLDSSPGSPHHVVKKALQDSDPSIYPTLDFNTFFLGSFTHYYRGWTCYVSPASDKPSFSDVLPTNGQGNGNSAGYSLLIRCEKAGETADDLNIAHISNFHMIAVAAYLNSMFSPGIIPYPWYPVQVITGVQQAVKDCIEGYIDNLELNVPITINDLNSIFEPVKNAFKTDFELW